MIAALAVLGLILLVGLIIVLNFFSVWIRAYFSGARVTFTEVIALRLRNVPVGLVVDSRITAVKSGLNISIDDLSTHYLAGGNIEMVVLALIAAQKAGIRLDYDRACAIDLATKGTGKTVLEAVKTSVNPKVIDAPAPQSGKTTIDGVAKDGIVIRARARVTVRTNLDRFVGGATEETIVALTPGGSRVPTPSGDPGSPKRRPHPESSRGSGAKRSLHVRKRAETAPPAAWPRAGPPSSGPPSVAGRF